MGGRGSQKPFGDEHDDKGYSEEVIRALAHVWYDDPAGYVQFKEEYPDAAAVDYGTEAWDDWIDYLMSSPEGPPSKNDETDWGKWEAWFLMCAILFFK